MSLLNSNASVIYHNSSLLPTCSSLSAPIPCGTNLSARAKTAGLDTAGSKERIRSLFKSVEVSVSAFDTAWVAMVPSPDYSQAPCFPSCVNWVLENQHFDGSWGLTHKTLPLIKDDLSSTLACILALKRWGVGEEQINKGSHFLELNFASANDENQHSPIGFDIIFPGMLEYAKTLNLKLPLDDTVLDVMLKKRTQEIKRCSSIRSRESEEYLAFVSEGMGSLQNWDLVMKYQRKNGSLFNSPSTTAASLSHLQNTGCLNYLHHLVEKFGDAVPTVYPIDIYARLHMVDTIQKLGLERHFRQEIRSVLDETYSCWLKDDEQIFLDVATCALAFRILRVNGYHVLSDKLAQIAKEENYFNSLGGPWKDTSEVLELYKASQTVIYPSESALEKQNLWSKRILKSKLSNGSAHSDKYAQLILEEVQLALKLPFHSSLERLVQKQSIEQYKADTSKVLKTSYCSANISNIDFQKLAVEDFNICQSIHQEELKLIQSWVVDNNLDKLNFSPNKIVYCYMNAADMMSAPELQDARMSCTKHGILAAVTDDLFDLAGSMEEFLNLVQLVEKWNVNEDTEYSSEHVRIIFWAIRNTICETADRAFKLQARDVKNHIIEIWLEVLNTMLTEAKWARDSTVPKLDEYMENGYVSFALGPIVLPTTYLVGPKLSEEVVRSAEFHSLFKHMSNCGRLLSDIRGLKRVADQGKLNFVILHMIHTGASTEEDAIRDITFTINEQTRELLRLVLQEKGSVVPRACKDLFWTMNKVVHQFYSHDDGFTKDIMLGAVNAIIHEPITLNYNC